VDKDIGVGQHVIQLAPGDKIYSYRWVTEAFSEAGALFGEERSLRHKTLDTSAAGY
jgi:hypothetical protein